MHPSELQPPAAGAQKERKNARRRTEDAVRAQPRAADAVGSTGFDGQRARALEALAGFHATDSRPDPELITRVDRRASRYRRRREGPLTITYEAAPHLRPEALRMALAGNPRPVEIELALQRLGHADPAARARLREDPAGAIQQDLALLVAETQTAWRTFGLEPRDIPAPVVRPR